MTTQIPGCRARADESGFTVVEIVVAASVLFFVLTAILGLTLTSTHMTVNAKERNALTNAIASEVERIRALPFDQVAMHPLGDIQETMVLSDRGITLTFSVQDGPGQTREVHIVGVLEVPGRQPVRITEVVYVRDKDLAMTRAPDDPLNPRVRFGRGTPSEGSVIYGNRRWSGGGMDTALEIDCEITIPAGSTAHITQVRFWVDGEVDGVLLRDGSSPHANYAEFSAPDDYSASARNIELSFRWDTRQVSDAGTRTLQDGWRTVRIEVIDSDNRKVNTDRRFYLDNDVASHPGVPVATVRTDTSTVVNWEAAKDGSDVAQKYMAEIYQQTMTDTSADPLTWTPRPSSLVDVPAFSPVNQAFSRYFVRVRAGGPLSVPDVASSWSAWTPAAAPYVTRPRLMGEARVTRDNRNRHVTETTMRVTQPTFPTTYVKYQLLGGTAPDALTVISDSIATPAGFTDTRTTNQFTAYYYGLRVEYRVAGSDTTFSVLSNVVGPTENVSTWTPLLWDRW